MTTRLGAMLAPLAMLLLAAGPANAQGVLVDKSEIRFTARQMGVNVEGHFRKWKANIVFLPQDLAKSRAAFDIELGSIDLASEDSEAQVKDRLWFDIVKFPVAHFVSTSLRDMGGDKYIVAGQLSLKGVVRESVVPIVVKKDAAGNRVAEGSFAIKRLEYNIGQGLWADPDMVANEVVVRVRMVLPPAK